MILPRTRIQPIASLYWAATLFIVSCGLLTGCGGGIERVVVEGVVTLDGRPLEGAAITFMPTSSGRPGVAVTDAAGRFTLQENGMRSGVVLGEYAVVITKIDPGTAAGAVPHIVIDPTDRESFLAAQPRPMPPQPARNLIPSRYAKSQTSDLRATVSRATTDLLFSLTSKP